MPTLTSAPSASVEQSTMAAPALLKLLTDETRWALIEALRYSDAQVGDLAQSLGLPHNLVSYHLGVLRRAGLVKLHRSDADGRGQYYGLDRTAFQALYADLGAVLPLLSPVASTFPPITVVFVSSQNRTRSQMAEGWLRQLSRGQVIARSAGVTPTALHPLTIEAMAEARVDIGFQRAKGLSALEGLSADVVITLCDLAREQDLSRLRAPFQFHWSIPDPERIAEQTGDAPMAFRAVRDQVGTRVQGLLRTLPTLIAAPASDGGISGLEQGRLSDPLL